jgi:hypothetical protein
MCQAFRCGVDLPLAVMEIRGSGANQLDELFALGASVHFLIPIRPIILDPAFDGAIFV